MNATLTPATAPDPDPTTVAADAPTPRQQAGAVGMISGGHFCSHFYNLSLPPLFPFIKAEFGISYAALGLIWTTYFLATSVVQMPVGMLVDRIGARRMLFAGLLLMSGSVALAGLTNSYWMLLAMYFVAGIGNSVFHPADFVILSATVPDHRMGRAFSVHSFGGQAGSAAAPLILVALAVLWDWRVALVATGMIGVAFSFAMYCCRGTMREDSARGQRKKPGGSQWRDTWQALTSRTIMAYFIFFMISSCAGTAIISFAVVVLADLYAADPTFANGVLTAHLIAAAAGVVAGGFLADATRRHDLVLIVCMAVAAVGMAAAASAGVTLLIAAAGVTLAGLMKGVISPSRDLLVREAAPPGLLGSVMAFVTIGFTIGNAAMPVVAGWLIDLGHPSWVFWMAAAFSLAGIATVFMSRERRL
jgi:predicted MFS family arabinose efflux permease